MQEVKVAELLPNGLTKIEVPESDAGDKLAAFKVSMLEMLMGPKEAYERLRQRIPGMVKYCTYKPDQLEEDLHDSR